MGENDKFAAPVRTVTRLAAPKKRKRIHKKSGANPCDFCYFDEYYGEMCCDSDGLPCRLVCHRCKDFEKML